VIKPNLLVLRPASSGATTDPEVVRAVVQMCFEAGVREVVVAESSNWGVDTDAAFEALGYGQLARDTGCRLLNIKDDDFVEVEVAGQFMKRFQMPRTLCEADYVINVGKMKAHRMTYVTFGLKNLGVGSHNDDQKEEMHRIGSYAVLSDEVMDRGSGLDHNIVSVNLACRCDLTVVDGLVAQEGPGAPLTGDPVPAGLIVAGYDRVGTDVVASTIMGIDPTIVPHLVLAHEAGLGEIDIGKLDLSGVPLADIGVSFEPAIHLDPGSFAPPGVEVVVGRACYACLGDLAYYIKRHADDLAKLVPVTIYVGKVGPVKPPMERRHLVFYGNCAGEYLYGGGFATGCPPRSRRQVFQSLGALDLYTSDENIALSR
jgi:uncharacterized protein (DUF362 family)